MSSPGGDGETALRMVRSVQLRCRGLTVVVPDMARSAATILCLGAHHILMGPGGDLGPIGPQMLFPGGDGKPAVASPAVASAKEVVAAVAEAEERIKVNPDSFPLFASLLSDATMLMVEQARAALSRSGALMQEASRAQGRSEEDVQSIGLQTLEEPLIDAPASHSAVISVDHAAGCGLPADRADVGSERWRLIWRLRTRHCALGCWPMGGRAIHEGARASHAG
ncbi:serine dehydrogenase [Propionibacterium acidifaciens]|uniref:serine dehydrogenase n=3 Tax=Propionibacterium acidifaciens TaxID=556499 RepID=UPI0028ED3799|nr:serine dehydrogenase [Propionibacterium acidifaciens]